MEACTCALCFLQYHPSLKVAKTPHLLFLFLSFNKYLSHTEATVKEDEDEKEKNTSPFTDDRIERIKHFLEKEFEREKEDAQCEGQITCLLTGRQCCFYSCGPHLTCPEHSLNYMEWYEGDPAIPKRVDPLLKRWMHWRVGSSF